MNDTAAGNGTMSDTPATVSFPSGMTVLRSTPDAEVAVFSEWGGRGGTDSVAF